MTEEERWSKRFRRMNDLADQSALYKITNPTLSNWMIIKICCTMAFVGSLLYYLANK